MFFKLAPLIFLMMVSGSNAQDAPNGGVPVLQAIPKVPSVLDVGLAPTVANISYGTVSSQQKLDLYLPSRNTPAPVVVYVHGGGFKFGTRTMASGAMVEAWLKSGYAVASIDYRLSDEAVFPAAVQDVFSAIAYLKQNARSLRIDGSDLTVFGESAGANLASMVGTAYDNAKFRADIGDNRISVRPKSVIALYPPVDFLQIDAMLQAQGCFNPLAAHNDSTSFESRYLGAALPSVPEKVAMANPANYASATSAPFFIQNGDQDCHVGAGQGKLLASQLERNGVRVKFEVVRGASHGGTPYETPENIQKILEFMKSIE